MQKEVHIETDDYPEYYGKFEEYGMNTAMDEQQKGSKTPDSQIGGPSIHTSPLQQDITGMMTHQSCKAER